MFDYHSGKTENAMEKGINRKRSPVENAETLGEMGRGAELKRGKEGRGGEGRSC
jgi:hypothetical protein